MLMPEPLATRSSSPTAPASRPRSRRVFTRLLIAGVLLYLGCIAAVALGPRVPGQTGYSASPAWVRACFWAGLGLIPVLFVLFAVRGFMWFIDSVAGARRRSAGTSTEPDAGQP
jgi:hypothetical protein